MTFYIIPGLELSYLGLSYHVIIPGVELERDEGRRFHGLSRLVHDNGVERQHPAATVDTLRLFLALPLSLSFRLCVGWRFGALHDGLYEVLGSAAGQSAAHNLSLQEYVHAVRLQHTHGMCTVCIA